MILLILLCFLIRRVSQFVELIRNIIERLFSLIRTVFLNAIDLYDCDFNYNKFFFFFTYSVKCCMIRFSSNVNWSTMNE